VIEPLLTVLSLKKSQMQRLMQSWDYQMPPVKKMHMKAPKILKN